jgi:hypothetical protein
MANKVFQVNLVI